MASLRKLLPRFSLRTLAIFTLLCTSGFGLWWRWEPWYLATETRERLGRIFDINFSGQGEAITVRYRRGAQLMDRGFGFRSGDPLGPPVGSEGPYFWACDYPVFSPNGERSVGRTSGRYWIFDVDSGEPLYLLHDEGQLRIIITPLAAKFSGDGALVAIEVRKSDFSVVRIYRRRRPEWWWGVFWLWEFWLTAAFAGLFVWSVVRDRKSLGREVV